MSYPSIPARRHWPVGLLAAAGATVLAVTMLTAPASAAPALGPVAGPYDQGPAGDPAETIAATYQAEFPDMSPEVAQQAAAGQAAGVPLKAAISSRWDSFGGGWYDPATATYHLAFTSVEAGEALLAVGAGAGARVSAYHVDRSLDALKAQAAELRNGSGLLARAADGHVGIDVKTNQVVAQVPAAQVPRLAAAAPAGVRVDPFVPEDVELDACTSRANCDDFLAAGLQIRNGNPGSPACSLGFTARAGGQRFMLTAGHCSSFVGQQWSIGSTTVRLIGTVQNIQFAGPIDVSRVLVTNPFYTASTAGRIYIGPPNATVPVNGESFLLPGDIACLSARFQAPATFGNPCAVVGSISDPAVFGLARIDGYDACPGDSGGGWYWFINGLRFAVALHSRSTGGCNVAGGNSWASETIDFHPDLIYETS